MIKLLQQNRLFLTLFLGIALIAYSKEVHAQSEDVPTINDLPIFEIDEDEIDTDEEQDAYDIVTDLEIIEDTSIARGATADGGPTTDIELFTEWVPPFMLMTEQFTALMLQQVQIIGTFFDAKHQLETQQLFQQKTAQAHKDYQPSAEMCQIGTFSRDLADAQQRIKVTRNVMAQAAINRALASGDVKTSRMDRESDVRTRRSLFVDRFCNIQDNTGNYERVCGGASSDPAQQNADLNYTQTIDHPLTIGVNFVDTSDAPGGGRAFNNSPASTEEENVFAFLDQIFMNEAFPNVKLAKTITHNFIKPYQEMRALIAMRSVAQNSFAHIIGEKTIGPNGEEGATPFIFSLLREMGMPDEVIEDYMGSSPSYYAQMEVLTKKIYQHPEFISNLYDKPTNIKRMRTALNAIKLMQDRDIHQAMLRREMLTSMLLEARLREKQNNLQIKADDFLSTKPGQKDAIGNGNAAGPNPNGF